MSPRSRVWIHLVSLGAWAMLASGGSAQVSGDARLEQYLRDRGLDRVLGAHLRARLATSVEADRVRAAEELGKLYVRLLSNVQDAKERSLVESQAEDLMRRVPGAETFELRLDLAKATYLRGEEIAERHRLRLASAAEVAEARDVLVRAGTIFREVGDKVDRRVASLESRQERATDSVLAEVRSDLEEARRLRSLAKYYSGWVKYYQAELTGSSSTIASALVDFGVILNATPGKPPTLDRLPRSLLVHEHVARASVGVALCLSMQGNDVEALRWLDEVAGESGVPVGVAEQIFGRRMVVLAGARRWSDAMALLERRLREDHDGVQRELTLSEARLVAVLALEGATAKGVSGGTKRMIDDLTQLGFGALIARGEIGHVLDLVSKYGTAPIGSEGFVVLYVRGLQSFDRARTMHKQGEDPDAPTARVSVANEYRDSAKILESAIGSSDAEKFASEHSRVRTRIGLARFYAGDFADAAEAFTRAYDATTSEAGGVRRDALWFAIVSLDMGIERGKPSLARERDRLAVLYLKNYPATDNAVRLLLRQSGTELMSEEDVLKVLLVVAPDAPTYEASRLQASRLLYRAYRRSAASDREFSASRFVEVSLPVLRLLATRASSGTEETSRDAAQQVVILARQIADALLASGSGDVDKAEEMVHTVETVAGFHSMDLSSVEPELAYRRLQIALARRAEDRVERELAFLREKGGAFARAADQLLYKRATDQWRLNPGSIVAARDVVRHGLMILEQLGAGNEATRSVVRDRVASAAAAIWEAEHDELMRDRAIALDREALKAGARTGETLRRLGTLLESLGDVRGAQGAWRDLSSGLAEGSKEWYEARYHTIRLLAKFDASAAREAMRQHVLLYPNYGPEPWDARFRMLEVEIPEAPPAGASPATPGASGSGTTGTGTNGTGAGGTPKSPSTTGGGAR